MHECNVTDLMGNFHSTRGICDYACNQFDSRFMMLNVQYPGSKIWLEDDRNNGLRNQQVIRVG